jgi:hypothetical protein
MSLRDKAREVKEAGVAERGNFAPHGVPKRIYQWWLAKSDSKKARAIRYGDRKENFCHFWRVVLFWAPLRFVGYTVNKYAVNSYVGYALAILCVLVALVLAILNPLVALATVGILVFIALQSLGVMAGVSAGLTQSHRNEYDLLDDRRYIALFFILGFALALPAYLITRFIRFYKERLTDYNKQIGLSVLGLVLVASTLILGTAVSWHFVLVAAAIVVAAGFVCVIGYFLVGHIADFIQGRRVLAQKRVEDALAVYLAENGHLPTREPSALEVRLGKILSGIGDFIVLVAQVIRVNKWKFCPTVEINDDERVSA